MKFDEYMRAVEDGNFPEDPRVPPGTFFQNDNGIITNLCFGKFGGVALLTCESGSIRSNHYHKTDSHFIVVMDEQVDYYWRPAGSKEPPKMATFRRGETFFTPPMVEHAVYSPYHSLILSVSKLSRRHDDHEADLVRVPLIRLERERVVVCA